MNRRRLAVCLSVVALVAPQKTAAQNPQKPDTSATAPSSSPSPPRWEIEVHGGLGLNWHPSGGTVTVPVSGVLIGGNIGLTSMFFGNGASLFNANAFGASGLAGGPQIDTLDPVLLAASIQRPTWEPVVGLRFARSIRPRFGWEASVDYNLSHLEFAAAAVSGIERTRLSYSPAVQRALSVSATPSASTAVTTFADHVQAQQVFLTGAFVYNLKTEGRAVPYILGGGGMVFSAGATPVASLVGTYQIGNPVQITGTDSLTIYSSHPEYSVVVTGGGGVKYDLTSRWGLRVDGRLQIYRDETATIVDASPRIGLTSTAPNSFPLINSGGVQFSATAPLNGVPLVGAQTFVGSSLHPFITVVAGVFMRF
jgi:hypothetical protein